MAEGVPLALRTYREVIDFSDAQSYLNMTMTALRTELYLANHVEIDGSGNVGNVTRYLNPSTGYCLLVSENDKDIYISDRVGGSRTIPLITNATARSKLRTSFDSFQYNKSEGIFTFTNLKVSYQDGSRDLAVVENYQVRTANVENIP